MRMSRLQAPAPRMLLPGPDDPKLNGFDYDDESNGVGQDAGDIEILEIEINLKPNPIAAPEQFDHQHDFPRQREAGAHCCGEIGFKLRQHDMAKLLPAAEAIDLS